MYRPRKRYGKDINARYSRRYESSRYKCQDCRIACTSPYQLEQHLNGIKHQKTLYGFYKEQNTFPMDHMVVLDQTEEDIQTVNAASPASCDSSESATAASASDFQATDLSRMVILDETNDDNYHPASPASCDSSDSESAPSCSATVKTPDVTPKKKKSRSKTPEGDETAAMSPSSVLSSCSSSNSAPEAENVQDTLKESTGKKHHAKSDKTQSNMSKKTFPIEPVKSNQDVFHFLKTFAVANESDVAFAKKVKEMFSSALRKYKELKLEEIFCTEAEHSSAEELPESTDVSSDQEQMDSAMPLATNNSECERINSTPGSPANSSTSQCISNPLSYANCQTDSPTVNQSVNPDVSSTSSRSPTNICEDFDTSSKPSVTNSTNDNFYTTTEADLLMESENCVTAEASCSDDEDV
ncbi:uncharacterized protein LOC142651751 isoform X2 [Rhinoderma darwinii]|uniref:uncharacterized protein LOC142651751 isoform X2 n=1 Tax=Rhinoderma darwinii TaxID=43563 RepID=UPI003F674FC3